MLEKIKANAHIFALLFLSLVLCLLNYSPGTFLSGWDTLHPEFNFGLNITRTFFGVFRVEQGLGAVLAHAHIADLPRMIFLLISSIAIPVSFLRYLYIFVSLIAGTLGMYLFLNKSLIKNKNASFLGALFYLLNLGTVQTFNVPFEMFIALYATFPFIFYFATRYITEKEHRAKNLFLLAVSLLCASPSAYAPTLWYVFFLIFSIYFLILSIQTIKNKKEALKRVLILIFVALAINSFWILPNLYFISSHAEEVKNSNINKLFSEQAFLKNKEFGNLLDILLLRTFYFDWNIYNSRDQFIDLLSPYISYLSNPVVLLIGVTFGFLFIVGLAYMVKSKRKASLPILSIVFISLFFLINDNFPTSPIFRFFQDNLPLFKEALRFPDNKILNEYIFLVSILFAFSSLFLINLLDKYSKHSKTLILLVFTALILVYNLPSFAGNFINPLVRTKIPDYYFDLFKYLENEPGGRVANLPINSPYGWVYYKWYEEKPSYQGAGFLYFGIKQGLLDRDFDRWSPFNEGYYREMSYAIYKKDTELLRNVLRKFNISHIFIDKSVIDPQHPDDILYNTEAEQLIKDTNLVIDTKEYGSIKVFKIQGEFEKVKKLSTNFNVSPITDTTYTDYPYFLFKDYISQTEELSVNFQKLIFPFRQLINNQSHVFDNILKIDDNTVSLSPSVSNQKYQIDNLKESLTNIPSDILVETRGNILSVSFHPNTPYVDDTPTTSPIFGELSIPSNHLNLVMSINSNELFRLDKLPNSSPFALGKANLQNADNTLSMYDLSQLVESDNLLSSVNPAFSSCDGSTTRSLEAYLRESSIALTSNENICVTIPMDLFKTKNISTSEILVLLNYRYSGEAKTSSCIWDNKNFKCLYYRDSQKDGDINNILFSLPTDKIDDLSLRLFFEKVALKKNEVNLSNISLSYALPINQELITEQTIKDTFIIENDIEFENITFPKNIAQDVIVTEIDKFENDCTKKSDSKKQIIINPDKSKTIRYISTTGSFCDHFSYNNLVHKQGYLMVVESKNESGLPLTICLTNYTSRRCDIYSDLTSSNEFKKDVFLLPPMGKDGVGYDVNIENLGIKGTKAINYLNSIEFIPIPYEFLQTIKARSGESDTKQTGKILDVFEVNPTLFILSKDNLPLIAELDLSYDKGFKAYYIKCDTNPECAIKAFLSPFYAEEEKDHVLVNNWANGWFLKENQSKVAIVFVPQYFGYLGMILLISSFIFILLSFHSRRKTKSKALKKSSFSKLVKCFPLVIHIFIDKKIRLK